jgi:hypothetical protein
MLQIREAELQAAAVTNSHLAHVIKAPGIYVLIRTKVFTPGGCFVFSFLGRTLGSRQHLPYCSRSRAFVRMHSTIQINQLQAGPESGTSALLFQLQDDSPHSARVPAAQQLLFPSSPRSLCDEMGLAWQAALRLHEEGWLSFSIETTLQLDEAQEAELRFIGALVLAGCDRNMLGLLLAGLPRPYAYALNRLYFDWSSRHWRLLPDPRHNPEATFTDWVELLVQTKDMASLAGIMELAQDALDRVKAQE